MRGQYPFNLNTTFASGIMFFKKPACSLPGFVAIIYFT